MCYHPENTLMRQPRPLHQRRTGRGVSEEHREHSQQAENGVPARSYLRHTKYEGPPRRNIDFEIEHPDNLATDWEGAEDIPMIWKHTVD